MPKYNEILPGLDGTRYTDQADMCAIVAQYVGEGSTSYSGELWCANCGDTRAVLFTRHGICTRLSIDHTPNAAGETERIKSVGGIVEFNCLDGVLEVRQKLCCSG